jgi:hypothetical protein
MKRLVSANLIGAILMVTSTVYGLVPGQIADRATLQAMLGINAKTETFENISLPPNGLLQLGDNLNSSSVHLGYGPGLVIPGVSFRNRSDVQIYSSTFSGGTSKYVGYSSGDFWIEFSPPVLAIGMDVYSFAGYSGSTHVNIVDPNDITVGDFVVSGISGATVPKFLGFENAGRISKVLFSTFTGGPILDNVTFGIPVPEPASVCLISAAVVSAILCRNRGRR